MQRVCSSKNVYVRTYTTAAGEGELSCPRLLSLADRWLPRLDITHLLTEVFLSNSCKSERKASRKASQRAGVNEKEREETRGTKKCQGQGQGEGQGQNKYENVDGLLDVG